VLTNDLQGRGIRVDFKDLNYEVLDSDISDRFVKAINFYSKLLDNYQIEWTEDVFDCDDFAVLFKAVCGLYRFTCAYAEGNVYLGGELYGRHAYNLIPYMVGTQLVWLVVEPQVVGVRGVNWYNVFDMGSNRSRMLGLYIYVTDYAWI